MFVVIDCAAGALRVYIYVYSDVVVQPVTVVYAAGCWVPHLTMYESLSSIHGTIVHASKWLIVALLVSCNTLVSSCTTRTCFRQPHLYVLRDNIVLVLLSACSPVGWQCKGESGAYILGGVVVIMFCVLHLNGPSGQVSPDVKSPLAL